MAPHDPFSRAAALSPDDQQRHFTPYRMTKQGALGVSLPHSMNKQASIVADFLSRLF
jgi:hypothetical protein